MDRGASRATVTDSYLPAPGSQAGATNSPPRGAQTEKNQPCFPVVQLLSRVRLFVTPWDSLGQNTGVGCHSLLQGIFPTQGLNWGLLPCRRILYQLSYQGSPTEGYEHLSCKGLASTKTNN